jgi:hypothetical protein
MDMRARQRGPGFLFAFSLRERFDCKEVCQERKDPSALLTGGLTHEIEPGCPTCETRTVQEGNARRPAVIHECEFLSSLAEAVLMQSGCKRCPSQYAALAVMPTDQ